MAAGEVGEDTPAGQERIVIVNLSGRGDKDVSTAAAWFGLGRADAGAADGTAESSPVVDDADEGIRSEAGLAPGEEPSGARADARADDADQTDADQTDADQAGDVTAGTTEEGRR